MHNLFNFTKTAYESYDISAYTRTINYKNLILLNVKKKINLQSNNYLYY